MMEAPALHSYNGGSRVLLSNTPHFRHVPTKVELEIRRIQVNYKLLFQSRLQAFPVSLFPVSDMLYKIGLIIAYSKKTTSKRSY